MESGILIKSTVLKKEEKMKKIYTIIFVSCLAAISFSSCSDWLDVRPEIGRAHVSEGIEEMSSPGSIGDVFNSLLMNIVENNYGFNNAAMTFS